MTDPLPRLLARATRLLEGKPAERDLACGELMARVAHAAPCRGDDPLERAVERLEGKAPAPRWRLVLLFFVAAVGILTLLVLYVSGQVNEIRRLKDGLNESNTLADIESRHRQHPDDPALFHDFVWRFLWEHNELPPDFRATWQRIDPENAVWATLEGVPASAWKNYFHHPGLSESERAKTRDALHEAAGMKRWTGRPAKWLPGCLSQMQRPSVVTEIFVAFTRFYPDEEKYQEELNRGLRKFLTNEIFKLVESRDSGTLRQLTNDWMGLLELRLRDTALCQIVISHSYLRDLRDQAKMLERACRSLDLKEEAARLASFTSEIDEIQMFLNTKSDPYFMRQVSFRISRVRSDGSFNVPLATPITPADLTPARLAEYAVADRLAAVVAVVLVMVALLGAAFEAWRRGVVPNHLAHGLGPLFRHSDHAWVWGLGLVAPVLWCWIVRLSPLGGRDIAINWFAVRHGIQLFQPWLTQTLGTVVLALALLVQSARWRWAKRGACLSLRAAHLWLGWAMVGLLAAVVPAIGAIRYLTRKHDLLVFAVSGCGGFALLWLIWQAAATLFAPREGSLAGVLLCRSLIPAFAMMGLLALGSIPLFQHAERAWVACDKLSLPDPDGRGATGFEVRVTEAIRQRLLKGLEGP